VMVSEIPENWIDEIGPDGGSLFSVRATVSYPSDPQARSPRTDSSGGNDYAFSRKR